MLRLLWILTGGVTSLGLWYVPCYDIQKKKLKYSLLSAIGSSNGLSLIHIICATRNIPLYNNAQLRFCIISLHTKSGCSQHSQSTQVDHNRTPSLHLQVQDKECHSKCDETVTFQGAFHQVWRLETSVW